MRRPVRKKACCMARDVRACSLAGSRRRHSSRSPSSIGPWKRRFGPRESIEWKLGFAATAQVRSWQTLLQKSFCTRHQNFFWLYTRFSCKDVGDLIA